MPKTRRGTYLEGFAPRDFQPAYPGLWNGCVGAWYPGLGPTGATLRDWSGFQRHGTLTNTTLATAWAVNQGGYCLDLDGSNDFVTAGAPLQFDGISEVTLSAWVRKTTVAGAAVIGKWNTGGGTNNSFLLAVDQGAGYGCAFYLEQSNNTIKSLLVGTIVASTWTHLAAVAKAQVMSIWINGDQQAMTLAYDGTIKTSTASVLISEIGAGVYFWPGQLDDLRIYNRGLTPNEVRLLASRRGIAYESRLPVRYAAATGNRRRRLLCMGAA